MSVRFASGFFLVLGILGLHRSVVVMMWMVMAVMVVMTMIVTRIVRMNDLHCRIRAGNVNERDGNEQKVLE
jgi:heme/copper-type cytochrome/quinol oxidase subunit 3